MRRSKQSTSSQPPALPQISKSEIAIESDDPRVRRIVRNALKKHDAERKQAIEEKHNNHAPTPQVKSHHIDASLIVTPERILLELMLWAKRRQDFMFISALRFAVFGCFWTDMQYDDTARILLSLEKNGDIIHRVLAGMDAYILTQAGKVKGEQVLADVEKSLPPDMR